MDHYIIDLSGITDRESLHQRLRDSLPLPSWYGNNLDALNDSLSGLPLPFRITVRGQEGLKKAQPELHGSLMRLLRDLQEDIDGFELVEESPETEGGPDPAADGGGDPAPASRTLIITDIHGCYDECRMLLEKMGFEEDADRLICLGDTIDRGPKIFETFEYLAGVKERMGDRCVLIRGNHEQMMLDSFSMGRRCRELWYYNSGEKTVYSFIHNKHRIQEYIPWYEAMPYYYATDAFSCVHASLKNPDPAANEPETLLWGRETDYEGKLVMTGHTPYRTPLYFLGERYGGIQEDIRTMLPEKGMIALDTGCVYGNRLTGMVIHGDGTFHLTSVPSGTSAGRRRE